MFVYIYAYIYAYTYVCTYVRTYVRTYIRTYVCMYAHGCIVFCVLGPCCGLVCVTMPSLGHDMTPWWLQSMYAMAHMGSLVGFDRIFCVDAALLKQELRVCIPEGKPAGRPRLNPLGKD